MISELKFLIVDDDVFMVETLSHLLQRLGARKISIARSGAEALGFLKQSDTRFDCLISDVRMEQGNGLELLYEIRTTSIASNYRPDMCVILMSSIASTDVAGAARCLDVNAFLVKPFTINKLHLAITSARRRTFPLDRYRYQQLAPATLRMAS